MPRRHLKTAERRVARVLCLFVVLAARARTVPQFRLRARVAHTAGSLFLTFTLRGLLPILIYCPSVLYGVVGEVLVGFD